MGPPHQVQDEVKPGLERHVQTVLIALTTAGIAFTASYIYDANRSNAIQQAQLASLTGVINELRSDVKALQGNWVRREEFDRLESRIRNVEMGQRADRNEVRPR